jgi:hypothetical protein
MKRNIFILLILTQFCFGYATDNLKKTGTFTNMVYNKEAGDLLGFEVRIVFTRNGYEGTFQAAEGVPDNIILLKKIVILNDTVKFSILPPSLYEGIFIGRLTKFKLIGLLTLKNGNKIDLKLKRGRSYWD